MGLDLGGSGAKAAVYGIDGALLASAKVGYGLESPRPHAREFDPRTQWSALSSAIATVSSAKRVRRDPVRAVGIAVAGEAVVPVAANGEPLHNAISSFDPRGLEYVSVLREKIGDDAIFRITGQPLDGMYSLMRMLWFRDNLPSLFRDTAHFYLWQELVLTWLGVSPALDFTNALRTLAFDIQANQWSDQILDCVGIDRELFATTVPQGATVGTIDPRIAHELGLARGCIAVAGGLDQSCAALGLGAIDSAVVAIATGSTEAIGTIVDSTSALVARPRPLHYLTPHVQGGLLATATNLTAGSAVEWCKTLLHRPSLDDFALYGALPGAALHPSRLLAVPHFAGSFTPDRAPGARASLFGLTLDVSEQEVAQALLEGLVFELRLMMESFEGLGVTGGELRNGGGGANSQLWMRLKATILNRPIVVARVTDSTSLGAAMLAGVADGAFSDSREAASAMVRMRQTYEPEERAQNAYAERYEDYVATRSSLRVLEAQLARTALPYRAG